MRKFNVNDEVYVKSERAKGTVKGFSRATGNVQVEVNTNNGGTEIRVFDPTQIEKVAEGGTYLPVAKVVADENKAASQADPHDAMVNEGCRNAEEVA